MEQALEDFRTQLVAAAQAAVGAGATPATLARVSTLVFESIFASKLAEDPDNDAANRAMAAMDRAGEALESPIAAGE